eukprot:m.78468 g.78468  ORF g.78468 m.78468 type:complete len:65 (+) comp14110_c0_seq2:330-524(+)
MAKANLITTPLSRGYSFCLALDGSSLVEGVVLLVGNAIGDVAVGVAVLAEGVTGVERAVDAAVV